MEGFAPVFDQTVDGVEVKATLDEAATPPTIDVSISYKGFVVFSHRITAAEAESVVERLADYLKPFFARIDADFYNWYREAYNRVFPKAPVAELTQDSPATSQPALRVP